MRLKKLEVEGITKEQLIRYTEIFEALITTGSLDGVRSGAVHINFDHLCVFQSIKHDYTPWRRRKPEDKYY